MGRLILGGKKFFCNRLLVLGIIYRNKVGYFFGIN